MSTTTSSIPDPNGHLSNAAMTNETSSSPSSDEIPVIYYVIVLVSLMLCCLAMILIFYWYHHRNLVNLIRTTSPRKPTQSSQNPDISIDHTRSTNNIPIPMPSPSSKLPKPPIKLRPNQINLNMPSPHRKHTGGHTIDESSTQKSVSPKPNDMPAVYHPVNNSVLPNSKYIYNPYMGGINQYGGLPMIVPGAAPPIHNHNHNGNNNISIGMGNNITIPITSIGTISNLKIRSTDSMRVMTDIAPTEARTALSDITTSSSEESIIDEEDNFDSVSTRMKQQSKLYKKTHNKRLVNNHMHNRRLKNKRQSNSTNITFRNESKLRRKQSDDTNITFRIKELDINNINNIPTSLTDVTTTVI